MVYAIISDLDYSSGEKGPTGSIRLVYMGEIPKPKDMPGRIINNYYHDEFYFSNYEDAKAYFERAQRDWASPFLDNSRIQFLDDTSRRGGA